MTTSNGIITYPGRHAPRDANAIPYGSYRAPYAPVPLPYGGLTLKEKVVYSLLGIGALGTAIYFGRRAYKNYVSGKAHAKSFEDGTPETFAKQIKMAFENDGWLGTDMEKLRTALQQIKSKQELKSVYDAYKREFGSNMYEDMQDELQSSQYNEALQIMAGKPDKAGQTPSEQQYKAWARRLKAAFDKTYGFIPGTDEPAIKAVFAEIPTQAAFFKVAQAYKGDYGQDMDSGLRSELEFWEYPDYMAIINQKAKA